MNPPFTGTKVVTEIDLDEVYKQIDTRMLFVGHWHFKRTKDSETAYQKMLKEKAMPALEKWKKKCRDEKIFEPKAVYGYFDSSVILSPQGEGSSEHICKLGILRSLSLPQNDKRSLLPIQLVTVGEGAVKKAQWLFAAHEYTDYLYLCGLAASTAEALAEYWHKKILRELGMPFNAGKKLPTGSRISPGYPSWPNLADQKIICDLLDSKKIGVTLTENYQLVPEYSTSALIVI